MKKSQRSFVVEYQNGRRKSRTRPSNSIWGNLDLKSVGREVDTVLTDAGGGLQYPGESRPETKHGLKVEASESRHEIAVQKDQRDVVSDAATEVETGLQDSGLADATTGTVGTNISVEQRDMGDVVGPEPTLQRYLVPRKKRALRIPGRKIGQPQKTGKIARGPLAVAQAMTVAAPAYELAELEAGTSG